MAFLQSKVDSLKKTFDILTLKNIGLNEAFVSFEQVLHDNKIEHPFFYVISKSDPDEEGLCSYKELAWYFFHGPLPKGYDAGWHYVIRNFKSTEANYGNQSLYINLVAQKAIFASSEDKIAVAHEFDNFLDAFRVALENIISK